MVVVVVVVVAMVVVVAVAANGGGGRRRHGGATPVARQIFSFHVRPVHQLAAAASFALAHFASPSQLATARPARRPREANGDDDERPFARRASEQERTNRSLLLICSDPTFYASPVDQ